MTSENEKEIKDLLLDMRRPRSTSNLEDLKKISVESDSARHGVDLGLLELDETVGIKLTDYDTDIDLSTFHNEKLKLSYQFRPVNLVYSHKLDVWEFSDYKTLSVRNKLSIESIDQDKGILYMKPEKKGFLPGNYDISKVGRPAVTSFNEVCNLFNKINNLDIGIQRIEEKSPEQVIESVPQRELIRRELIDIFTATDFNPYDKRISDVMQQFGDSRYSVDLGYFTIPKTHRVYMRKPWGGWDENLCEPDYAHKLPGKELFASLNSYIAKGQRRLAIELVKEDDGILKLYEVRHYDYAKMELEPDKNIDVSHRVRSGKTMYKFDENSFLTLYQRFQEVNNS